MDPLSPPLVATVVQKSADTLQRSSRSRLPVPVGMDEATLRAWMLRNMFPSVFPGNYTSLVAQSQNDSSSDCSGDDPADRYSTSSPSALALGVQGRAHSAAGNDLSERMSDPYDGVSTVSHCSRCDSEEDFVVVSLADMPPCDTFNVLPRTDSDYEFIGPDDAPYSSYNGLPDAKRKKCFVNDTARQVEQMAEKWTQTAKTWRQKIAMKTNPLVVGLKSGAEELAQRMVAVAKA